MALKTYGINAVDWEARVDLPHLRSEHLAPSKEPHLSVAVERMLLHLRNPAHLDSIPRNS
jgi:hypothetical protein